jgi:hypothetical protein
LEKAREATDLANLRSAYAECSAEILTADTETETSAYKKVNPQQTTSGWVTSFDQVGSIAKANVPDIKKGTPVYVVVNSDGSASITTTKPTDAKAKEVKAN